jgi:hypothetical protein
MGAEEREARAVIVEDDEDDDDEEEEEANKDGTLPASEPARPL